MSESENKLPTHSNSGKAQFELLHAKTTFWNRLVKITVLNKTVLTNFVSLQTAHRVAFEGD